MFKSFDVSEVSSVTALKSSVVRSIKRSVVEMYPSIEPYIEDIIPKDGVKEGKGKDKLTFVVVEGAPLFFRVREGPYFPTLRLLHQCTCSGRGSLGVGTRPTARSAQCPCWCLLWPLTLFFPAPPIPSPHHLFAPSAQPPIWPAPARVSPSDPLMMARVRVDKGAIKFVLKGADVMCPGLTSAGGEMSTALPEGAPVAVYAEGKEHALAVGTMRLSTDDVRTVNKGVAIEALHFQGDDLFKITVME